MPGLLTGMAIEEGGSPLGLFGNSNVTGVCASPGTGLTAILFGFKVLPRLEAVDWLSFALFAEGATSEPDSSPGAVSLRAFAGDTLSEFGADDDAVAPAALF